MTASAHRLLAWALFAAFAAHNAEEALTMGAFLDHVGAAFLLTPFLVAVTAVTALGLVLVVAGTRGRPARWARDGLRILAAVMVVNAFVPHIPVAVLSGGYAPGVVTSVLLNVPLGVAYLVRTRARSPERAESSAGVGRQGAASRR